MLRCIVAVLTAIALVGCSASSPHTHASSPRSSQHSTFDTPSTDGQQPAHVVVVVEENHGYHQIIGNPKAPYINRLAHSGRQLTQIDAITNPIEPKYLSLFSGSTQGLSDDSCPHTFAGPNIGAQLLAHHRTFVGYSQDLPQAGSTTCSSGAYARKHAPWVNFSDLPAAQTDRPFSSFPSNYASLPTVSFVVPNLYKDMHSGSIASADAWLHNNLGSYLSWASSHNSQLIITWDEGESTNHIATIILGAGVTPGRDGQHATLYSLLRLIETEYGLRRLGAAGNAAPISVH